MADKRDSTALEADPGAPMSRVFLEMGPDQSEEIILDALTFRNEAPEGVRASLNAALDNHVKMERFRRPSRADASLLKDPTLYQLIARSNDKLAGALFRAWTESKADLRGLVEGALADADIPVDPPDYKVGRFNAVWDAAEFRKAREAVESAGGVPGQDKTWLMMMCLSGKSREGADEPDDFESDMFGGFIGELEKIPPDALEWKEAPAFVKMINELLMRKIGDLDEYDAERIDEGLNGIRNEYKKELAYLEVDISAWTGEFAVEKNAADDAKDVARHLAHCLEEYRKVHPRGKSKSEETERESKRAALETDIAEQVALWDKLEGTPRFPSDPNALAALAEMPEPGSRVFAEMARLRKMESKLNDMKKATDEIASDQTKEDIKQVIQDQKEMKGQLERLESANSDLKSANSDLRSQNDAIAEDNARLRRSIAELEAAGAKRDDDDSASEAAAALETEVGRLGDDNRRLAQENEGLRFDKDLLAEENDSLRTDLARSGESEEYWRSAYVAASAGQTRAAMGLHESGDPETVNEALDIAQSMFPNELAIALNSKSSKSSPFRKPDETLAALSWLATEYRRRRTSQSGGRPDFNKLLKESCPGWFYKPGQTEVTAEQFIEWYTTSVDGKTHRLYHHIGKGNSHDPQNTIRIAFAWDDEGQRVVVGFLGLHQRNRRS